MNRTYYRIINGITFYRLLAMPFLLLMLFYNDLTVFKWGLLISFLTDAIDGFLARFFKVSSVLGAKLDSIGDDLTVATGIIGIVVVDRSFLVEQMFFVVVLLLLFVIEVGAALIRYGKTTSFHTWFAKLAAVLQALFLLSFFFTGPLYWLFYAAVLVTAIDLVEEIVMIWLLRKYSTDVKGIYEALKLRRRSLQGGEL